MSTQSRAATDSATMLRRNLRHARRYPAMTAATVGTPVVLLLLFVGVLGGTLDAGLGRAAGAGYVDYVAPGSCSSRWRPAARRRRSRSAST